MSRTKIGVVLCVSALSLTACGDGVRERALSGAGIGAASGAVAGVLIPGVGIGVAVLVGVGVGALTGALTEERDINLGKPFWKMGQ